jgi:hypothetical protein
LPCPAAPATRATTVPTRDHAGRTVPPRCADDLRECPSPGRGARGPSSIAGLGHLT